MHAPQPGEILAFREFHAKSEKDLSRLHGVILCDSVQSPSDV